MKAVVTRVNSASVSIDGVVVVPMERADAVADAAHALQEKEEKILHRILQDGVFDRPWLNAQLQALGCAPSKG